MTHAFSNENIYKWTCLHECSMKRPFFCLGNITAIQKEKNILTYSENARQYKYKSNLS